MSQVIYGLQVTANVALPKLFLQHPSRPLDVRVRLKESGACTSVFSAPQKVFYTGAGDGMHGEPSVRVSVLPMEYVGFFFGDGARFAVGRNGREVLGDWPENYSLEDACTYLVGPVLGFVLRLRGVTCLHASAVAIGHHAIALVGPAGSGKSTTAAALAQRGFPVLADDVVALTEREERFFVQPGYPRLNLWPDSVCTLFGSEDALPRITPTWSKRCLPLGENGHRFCSEPLPLAAIYILAERQSGLTAPVLEEMDGSEALVTLVANTYVNYLLDREMRASEFDVLGRLASVIPIRRLRIPADPSALPGLCQAIASDAECLLCGRDAVSAPSIR